MLSEIAHQYKYSDQSFNQKSLTQYKRKELKELALKLDISTQGLSRFNLIRKITSKVESYILDQIIDNIKFIVGDTKWLTPLDEIVKRIPDNSLFDDGYYFIFNTRPIIGVDGRIFPDGSLYWSQNRNLLPLTYYMTILNDLVTFKEDPRGCRHLEKPHSGYYIDPDQHYLYWNPKSLQESCENKECVVCYQECLTRTNCDHSLCSKCLEKIYQCPYCRRSLTLPKGITFLELKL